MARIWQFEHALANQEHKRSASPNERLYERYTLPASELFRVSCFDENGFQCNSISYGGLAFTIPTESVEHVHASATKPFTLNFMDEIIQLSANITNVTARDHNTIIGLRFAYEESELLDFLRPKLALLKLGSSVGATQSKNIQEPIAIQLSNFDSIDYAVEIVIDEQLTGVLRSIVFTDVNTQFAATMSPSGTMDTWKNLGAAGELCHFHKSRQLDHNILKKAALVLAGVLCKQEKDTDIQAFFYECVSRLVRSQNVMHLKKSS